jgi:hypothetical protein
VSWEYCRGFTDGVTATAKPALTPQTQK